LDLESGEVSQMPYPAEPIADLRRAQYSPDGSRLYRAAENDLVEMDLSSGADTKLKVEVAGQSLNSLALSHVMPDGRNLLVSGTDPVSRDRVLRLIPLPSGEPRDLMRVPQPLLKPDGSGVKHTLSPLSLVPDSRAVLVARETRSPGRVEADLWLVPLGGGEPKRIGGLGDTSDSLSITVSPDGRHLAYVLTDGVGPSPTKVWALENFLPKPATK
jgi:dipeptidyl aminopeptidase/acylaminoacyl peptidase